MFGAGLGHALRSGGQAQGAAPTGVIRYPCVLASLARVPIRCANRALPIPLPPVWIPAFAGMTNVGRTDGSLK